MPVQPIYLKGYRYDQNPDRADEWVPNGSLYKITLIQRIDGNSDARYVIQSIEDGLLEQESLTIETITLAFAQMSGYLHLCTEAEWNNALAQALTVTPCD